MHIFLPPTAHSGVRGHVSPDALLISAQSRTPVQLQGTHLNQHLRVLVRLSLFATDGLPRPAEVRHRTRRAPWCGRLTLLPLSSLACTRCDLEPSVTSAREASRPTPVPHRRSANRSVEAKFEVKLQTCGFNAHTVARAAMSPSGFSRRPPPAQKGPRRRVCCGACIRHGRRKCLSVLGARCMDRHL